MVLIDYSKGTFQNTGKGKHGKFSQTITFYAITCVGPSMANCHGQVTEEYK